jgi:protein-glutamine gamma-glutamyltransferase
MALKWPRFNQLVTLLLLSVAYATCEIAAYLDGLPRPVGLGFGIGLFLLAFALMLYVRPEHESAKPTFKMTVLVGVLMLGPLVIEPLIRSVYGEGFPLELQLVNGLRIVGLVLAGLSAWRQLRRLAGLVALFLALFSSAMGDQAAIPYLLTIFALMGGLWLIIEYQTNSVTTQANLVGELAEKVPLRVPGRPFVLLGLVSLVGLSLVVAGPRRVLLYLGEFMPTSGGTGQTDLSARSGVGDGPEETAGDNARSAGMVETDKMIEDNKNSLIDAVNDMFGQTHKPNKDQERMVAAGLLQVTEYHGRLPENRRPSRDFGISRQGPKKPKNLTSQKARGVFEVEGRTPLHVRLVAYEQYDDVQQRWLEGRKPNNRYLDGEADYWMRINNFRDVDWYSANDRHKLKVADLRENLVPTPSHLQRFRINRVDRPDYYEWDFDGVLALAGRKRTPPGVVVSTDCQTLDPRRLPETAFLSLSGTSTFYPTLREVPSRFAAEIQQLAQAWAGDQPRGWPQIQAIRDRLRHDFQHDLQHNPPENHNATLLWFLKDSRRGPDYLFATAAAMMYRSLGYPSRVCLGYYAAPENYDAETNHTPVKTADLHIWPEVLLSDGQWLVVEPTPGFETLAPLKTWQELFVETLLATGLFLQRNAILCGVLLLVGVLLLWHRRRIQDGIALLVWNWRGVANWRAMVLGAVRILEERGRFSGLDRGPSQSLSNWAQQLPVTVQTPALHELITLAEWAAYATSPEPPKPIDELQAICRQALRSCSYQQFRRIQSGASA